MKIHLRGHAETNSVWLNGKKLSLSKSLKVVNHSPTGFSWGYMGSGCAQLALAICIELFGKEPREYPIHYQAFKEKYITPLPEGKDFEQYIEVHVKKMAV